MAVPYSKTTPLRFQVAGIGAWGPGFQSWPQLAALLRQQQATEDPDPAFKPPSPERIPARERRRAPVAVKLAVEVAGQACDMAGMAPNEAACVFGSSMGDMDITDYMCRTLASDSPLLSPTRFHNSVHNAPVGYWSISTGCTRSGNAVCASRHTAPAGLLESIVQCVVEQTPVLCLSQDVSAPPALRDVSAITQACAVAVLLLPDGGSGPSMEAQLVAGDGRWPELDSRQLEGLYTGNPSAGLLPLLAQLIAESSPHASTLTEASTLELQVPVELPVNDHLHLRLESA